MSRFGERAFPIENPRDTEQRGMTLRDYFAGQALIGLVSFERSSKEGNEPEHFAKWAYALADAMMRER